MDPLQTTSCGTPEYKDSVARVLCLSRRVEWITRVEQCGLLRVWFDTGGSLQRVISVLRINRVAVISLKLIAMKEDTGLQLAFPCQGVAKRLGAGRLGHLAVPRHWPLLARGRRAVAHRLLSPHPTLARSLLKTPPYSSELL